MDGKTEEAIPLGVVYGYEWWQVEAQPPLRGWAADITWHDSFKKQPLLVLSHHLILQRTFQKAENRIVLASWWLWRFVGL